jgi:hypothetical protein
MKPFNPQIPLRYGLIVGGLAIIAELIKYMFYPALLSNSFLSGSLSFLILALILFLGIWAGISYRNENGNSITFSNAFLAIFIVFTFFTVGKIGADTLIVKVIDPEYPTKVSHILREKVESQMEKANMTDEQIKIATKNLTPEKFDPSAINLVKNLFLSLAIMAVVAALAALFIRRGSADLILSPPIDDPSKSN